MYTVYLKPMWYDVTSRLTSLISRTFEDKAYTMAIIGTCQGENFFIARGESWLGFICYIIFQMMLFPSTNFEQFCQLTCNICIFKWLICHMSFTTLFTQKSKCIHFSVKYHRLDVKEICFFFLVKSCKVNSEKLDCLYFYRDSLPVLDRLFFTC